MVKLLHRVAAACSIAALGACAAVLGIEPELSFRDSPDAAEAPTDARSDDTSSPDAGDAADVTAPSCDLTATSLTESFDWDDVGSADFGDVEIIHCWGTAIKSPGSRMNVTTDVTRAPGRVLFAHVEPVDGGGFAQAALVRTVHVDDASSAHLAFWIRIDEPASGESTNLTSFAALQGENGRQILLTFGTLGGGHDPDSGVFATYEGGSGSGAINLPRDGTWHRIDLDAPLLSDASVAAFVDNDGGPLSVASPTLPPTVLLFVGVTAPDSDASATVYYDDLQFALH
jgi:hypothetical protein